MNCACIFRETDHWALLIKPHGMPTAPLRENEEGTLLSWFLKQSPESGDVIGRKPVEHGLVHRLDTDTYGFVLIAKTQRAMDFFFKTQQEGLLVKTYRAFCSGTPVFTGPVSVQRQVSGALPTSITSQFRAFGPGRKQVRPVFSHDRHYRDTGTTYTTDILSISAERVAGIDCTEITCSLKAGFRHQVRAHLCSAGFPIMGDTLYNSTSFMLPMQLYADGIQFTDPESGGQAVFSLPLPDKTSR